MFALAGVRVVSLALNVPGPVAVSRLVAEGASVVKIEPPSGDPLRTYCQAWYDDLHASVEVVTLDLKATEGRAAADERLSHADVVITSQRPSALERLGMGPRQLAARFPALRHVAIVGDTATPEVAGHDVTYQAEAGLVEDRLPPTLLADMAGAERIVAAVLLVLRDPPGATRVVGLRDVVHDIAEPRRRGLTTAGAQFGGVDPAYNVYPTRDGYVAVAALEPHFRARLYAALDLPADSPIAAAMAARSSRELRALAAAHDVPLSVYLPASAPRC